MYISWSHLAGSSLRVTFPCSCQVMVCYALYRLSKNIENIKPCLAGEKNIFNAKPLYILYIYKLPMLHECMC